MAETGTLIVRTTAARNALPVAGASISVICPPNIGESTGACRRAVTDGNGQTPEITLPAPSAAASLNPENAASSYYLYTIEVAHPDYRPMTISNIAIFSGITSTLPVTMIPPRSEEEVGVRIFINSEETGPSGSGDVNG